MATKLLIYGKIFKPRVISCSSKMIEFETYKKPFFPLN